MSSWWNSLDVVSRLSSVSNWLIAILGLWVLIIGRRESQLQDDADSVANRERDEAIAETKRETAKANEASAHANERALKLENENLKLKLQLQPRIITPEQIKAFIASTEKGPFGPVDVVTDVSAGPEAKDYADAIRKMLRPAGFNPREPDFDMVDLLAFQRGAVRKEVIIWVKDPANAPPFVGNLQRGLAAIGIEAIGEKNTSAAPDSVMLYVGAKP